MSYDFAFGRCGECGNIASIFRGGKCGGCIGQLDLSPIQTAYPTFMEWYWNEVHCRLLRAAGEHYHGVGITLGDCIVLVRQSKAWLEKDEEARAWLTASQS